jgi:RHS repeat-associated protein
VSVSYDAYRRVRGYSAHPSETVGFDYDDAGSLRAVADPGARRLQVVAEADGRIQELIREVDGGIESLGRFSLAQPTEIDAQRLPREVHEQDDDAEAPHAGDRLVALAQSALAGDWSALWPARAARFETAAGANGEVHGVAYDDFGRVVRAFSSDAGIDEYTYGAGPDPLTYCRANGRCEGYEYDALGRPRSVTATSDTGEQSVTRLAYSGLRLASLANEQQTTRYRYDGAGRLVERIDTLPVGEYRYAWQFDERGRLRSQTLPDKSSLVPRYEDAGTRPTGIDLVDGDGRSRVLLDGITHNAIESFTGFRYGNGISKRMAFDDHGRLLTVQMGTTPTEPGSLLASVIPAAHGAPAAARWESGLSFDAHGRLAGVQQSGRMLSVRTDDDGRLLALGDEETFAYDAAGNLVERTRGASRHAFEYAQRSNQLARVDDLPVEHDVSGNVTRFAGHRITYGPDNRPLRIDAADGARVSYAYNALGERIRRTVSREGASSDSWFLYGDQRLEAELDADGLITGMYVFLGDEPIARVEHAPRGGWANHAPDWMVRMFADAPRITFIHADPLGTPRYATDEEQNVVWSAQYDAYGNAAIEAGSSRRINLRFAGQYFDDATGLHYNYLRDYWPAAGRYLQPDPAGLAGGLNLYEYAGANPLVANDVRGTSIVSWLGKRVGMRIVQREIRDYMERFVRTRIGQIVQRYSQRFSRIADQFGEADEIMQILNSAEGVGVWDVVGLIPVIGDAVDIGRTARQLCRIRNLMKRLDRKLIGFSRLPATGGSWTSGVPGNGIWRLADGRQVRFIDGFPDFRPFAHTLPGGRRSITITLGASHNADMTEVARRMRQLDPNWRQPPNTIWHHDTNCGVMILVDASINAIAHSGGRALHQQGLCP